MFKEQVSSFWSLFENDDLRSWKDDVVIMAVFYFNVFFFTLNGIVSPLYGTNYLAVSNSLCLKTLTIEVS